LNALAWTVTSSRLQGFWPSWQKAATSRPPADPKSFPLLEGLKRAKGNGTESGFQYGRE